ncbi:MAG: hypothetical protein P8Y36_05205, partial [Alphaproteobacteria bacterium]
MSRISIVLLILIILGFIMTIQRDDPGVITGDQSAAVVTTEHSKTDSKSSTEDKADKSKSADSKKTSQPTVALQEQADSLSPKKAESNILDGGVNLGRQVHRELARLGCFTGNVKQRWGRSSRSAVKRFNRIARFSWPDWPNRDLVVSLRNYPDGYCKNCRGGGGGKGCKIANATAPKDKTTKPERVKSDDPLNIPFGAAKSAAENAAAKEKAAKEAAERKRAAQEQAEKARLAKEKAAREAADKARIAREQAKKERLAREKA